MPLVLVGVQTPQRPTRRQVARILISARMGEMARLHAERDACPMHAIQAAIQLGTARRLLPKRLLTPDAWHRRVEMPAVRWLARAESAL